MEDVLELTGITGELVSVRHRVIDIWLARGGFTEVITTHGDFIVAEDYAEVTRRIALAVERSDRQKPSA